MPEISDERLDEILAAAGKATPVAYKHPKLRWVDEDHEDVRVHCAHGEEPIPIYNIIDPSTISTLIAEVKAARAGKGVGEMGPVAADDATLTFASGEAYGLTMEQGRRAIAAALHAETIPTAIDGAIKGMRVLRTMLNSRGLGGADVAEAIIADLERMNADPSIAPREPEMDLWPDDPAPIADKAVDHVFRELAHALGLETWSPQDGSETWEGDVYATMMRILYDAGVIDPNTNERAAIPSLEPQGAQEAVAWQHRCKVKWSDTWGPWEDGDTVGANTRDFDWEVRPLYASPTGNSVHGGVRVNPLEWVHSGNADVGSDENDEAETPFGGYVITIDPFTYSPAAAYYVDGPNWFKGQYASVGEAKAAAQADYESRIISALEPSPVHGGVSAEAVEAALKSFIKSVREQDSGWTEDIDEGEVLLVSPGGDFFAPYFPIHAALTAASVQQGKVGWQPIETAPEASS